MPRPGRPRRDSRIAVAGVGVHGRSIARVCQLGQVRALFVGPTTQLRLDSIDGELPPKLT